MKSGQAGSAGLIIRAIISSPIANAAGNLEVHRSEVGHSKYSSREDLLEIYSGQDFHAQIAVIDAPV